jgi:HPt (histidine-containing phosphotransfer) domain-containing protein
VSVATPDDFMAEAWARALPSIRRRLTVLGEAAAAATAGSVPADLLAAAATEAHRLIGSLGSYGLPAGTERARAVEALLLADPPDGVALTRAVASLAEAIAAGRQ